jgi:hypothetical protein
MHKCLILLALLVIGCREPAAPIQRMHAKARETDMSTSVCSITSVDSRMFDFDRNVIAGFEGASESLYVPSSQSGPTIGYGLDLGNAGGAVIRQILTGILSADLVELAETASGKTGPAAEAWTRKYRKELVLDSCQLKMTELREYQVYWRRIDSLRPWLNAEPSEIKTAILSFTMHIGNSNALLTFIDHHDWPGLATFIEHYHYSWSGPEANAFRHRRLYEAELIRLAPHHHRGPIDYD